MTKVSCPLEVLAIRRFKNGFGIGRVAAATSNRLSRLQPAALLKIDYLENRDPEHEKKATDIPQWMMRLRHV
jgi:hypothetical protein